MRFSSQKRRAAKMTRHGARFHLVPLALMFFPAAAICATITVPVPCDTVSDISSASGEYFPGAELFSKPGYPQLPVYSASFLLPPGCDPAQVRFAISNLVEETVQGTYSIAAAPYPAVRNNGTHTGETKSYAVAGAFTRDALYPESYLAETKTGMLREFTLATVSVVLYRYNPVTRALKRMKRGTLTIDFPRPKSSCDPGAVLHGISPGIQRRISKSVCNYAQFATEFETASAPSAPRGYAIITTTAIQSNALKLAQFIAFKESQGFTVSVVTQTQWGGSADNLRSWLQANYQKLGIEYALLLGDPDPVNGDVPMKIITTPQDKIPTDFYFGQLTGSFTSDGHAEVCVGRIPVYDKNYSVLDAILEKSMRYEQVSPGEIQWRRKALLIGADNGNFVLDTIKKHFLNPCGWTHYSIYDVKTGNPDESSLTLSSVVNAWKKFHFGFVQWDCHGTETAAWTLTNSFMTSSATAQLGNEYNPIVYMGCCLNAHPETHNNLSFSMLKNAAVVSVAATRNSYYLDGERYFANRTSNEGFVYEFAHGLIKDSLPAGDALDLVRSRGKISDGWLSNYCDFNVYGCPDIGIYSNTDPTASVQTITASSPSHLIRQHGNRVFYTVPIATGQGTSVLFRLYTLQGEQLGSFSSHDFHPGSNFLTINEIVHPKQRLGAGMYVCRMDLSGIHSATEVFLR